MRLPAVLFAIVLTLAGCTAPPPPAASTCTLDKVADFPVIMIHRNPTIVIDIDDHPERMIVDTGSGSTMILPTAFDALPTTQTARTSGLYGEGLGGTMQINTAIKEDFQIGKINLKDEILFVADFGFPAAPGQPAVDGLLGFDVLQLFDIAFDMPDHLITFYWPQCASQQTPWPGSYDIEPYIPRPDRLDEPDIATQIDGKTIVMAIDSGAAFSMVMRDAVAANGLVPQAIASSTGAGLGIGRRVFTYRREQFGSISLGAETFSNMWFRVSSRSSVPDSPAQGLLGEDYLAHHRVFLANIARTAYLGLTVPPQNQ